MLATIKFQLFSNILAFHDSSFKTSKSESGIANCILISALLTHFFIYKMGNQKKMRKSQTKRNLRKSLANKNIQLMNYFSTLSLTFVTAISDHVRHVTGYISEILDKLHGLASTFVFTDAVILQLSNINLPIFFVEGVNSLQLGALNVVRAVCSKLTVA